jgi:hypothetical protein
MNNEELLKENELLREQNEKLIKELEDTKQHLKKYTAPSNMKKYYETHKEDIKTKVKEYKEKTNYYSNLSADKKKEYARKAYENKKAKLEKIKMENQNI